MFDISLLRKEKFFDIIAFGSYPVVIQSILDFDYLSEKKEPSIIAIIAGGRKSERYFFGKKEILIPVFSSFDSLPEKIKNRAKLFINLSSGRRVMESSLKALTSLPNIIGGSIFAENVPEYHSILLHDKTKSTNTFLIGPASVGLLIPSSLKLGAIGGVDMHQLVDSHLFTSGNVAVFSSSGGMTNELINIVSSAGKRISFALSFGGDRFPIVSPLEAFLAAERDPQTEYIVYFGELGGYDEYEIAAAIKEGRITKQIICYIAGVISDMFPKPPQFGHAKAMAGNNSEGAKEKSEALRKSGVVAAQSFTAFVDAVEAIPSQHAREEKNYKTILEDLQTRKHAIISSSISKDFNGEVQILGEDLVSYVEKYSFSYSVISLFLGRKIKSKELEEFIDFILRLLVDHGPYVSGVLNTIVTARAGRDLVSSLSAGLLTIGPRFGGAINQAAKNWLYSTYANKSTYDFTEEFAKKKQYIPGIGHKKYRVDFPDPRVQKIIKFSDSLPKKRYTNFARNVEKITSAKKGNLILNVDGAIASVLLDILSEKEGFTDDELMQLAETEFFNALFVISRSVGFIAHFLDQKRLDEGLLRLTEDQVAEA